MSKKISELPEYIGIPQPVGDIPISISGTTYRISPLLLQKTNLTTSQTSINFTINSDTGTDAVVPLGNGVLAGATLNDYTTSEKNKLADTYTKGEVDTKITGVYKVKGSVANYASLPTSGRVIGDVWNLLDTGGNYVWTGTAWDELGTTIDISGKANIASPTFTGTPLAPTATTGTNNTQIATTAFIQTAIAGKMNTPSLTGNYIPKALTATTIGNSRLFDTGTKFGIGTTKTPTLDLTFGNQENITIGIEQSNNTNNGRDLILKAGRTINFVEGTGFQALNTGIVAPMYGSTIVPSSQDVYIASSGEIYKRTSGAGAFVAENSSVNAIFHRGMGVDTNGSVYLCMATGGFKKKTNNAGLWVQTTATGTSGSPTCVAGDYLGNLYFGTDTALYKQTGLTGSFVSVYSGGVTSITISPIDGSIYIITLPAVSAQILKQTAGTGSFNVIQSSAYCTSLCATISGDVYVVLGGSVLGKQTAGAGLFVSQGVNIVPSSMVSDSNGSLYATVSNSDVFFLDNNAVGSVNLDGGFYKNYAGTGKGTGKSRWQVYTGQKTTSGTNLQVETLRMEINEEGLATLPTVTNALIIADTTGKAIVTKEYVSSVASGSTNLTTSQSATNFTINSDTGTDAIVPLGNGTQAGATLNDYTTAEKNKLAGIATGAEVNVNADWNATTGDAVILNKPTIPSAVTQTSQLTNNGADGINPFITALDIPTTGQASTLIREVKNMTGATLTKGTVVYISGANGNKPLASKALATTDALSSRTFGLLQSDILNNELGNCVIIGDLSGLNTSAFTEGAQLYLSGVTAGTFTASKILAPTHLVYIGKVTRSHPTQGQIEVGIQNGYELEEVHDVAIATPFNGDVLQYESSTSLWKNKQILIGDSDFATDNNTYNSTLLQSTFATINDVFDKQDKYISQNSFYANPYDFGTDAVAVPFRTYTNQIYSGTIIWGSTGTAPTGTTAHTYSLSQVGNLVTLIINLSYTTAGAVTLSTVACELPSTAPTPVLPTSVSATGDVISYGTGMIINAKGIATTTQSFCALRLKSTSPNVFEVIISRTAAAYRYAYITIQYFV